jgi:hypothetical protein
MIDGIFVVVFARADERECAVGLVGGQHPRFGRGVAGRFQYQEFAVAGAAGAQIEALVVVLADDDIGGVRRAQGMAQQLVLALLHLVFNGVEEGAVGHPIDGDLSMGTPVVSGPHDGAHTLDFTGQRLAGFEILDVERVLAEAGGVGRVGEPSRVVGDVGGADRKEGLALGEQVAVENDVLLRIDGGSGNSAALAAVDGVLAAFLGARVVPPFAVAEGDRDVSLLHVREHFLIKVFAQSVERRHHGLDVGIFRVEIGGDFGILLFAQPCVVVGERDAVKLGLLVIFPGDVWVGQLVLTHVFISLTAAFRRGLSLSALIGQLER